MKQVKTKQTTTAATTKYGHKAKYKQTNKVNKQTTKGMAAIECLSMTI